MTSSQFAREFDVSRETCERLEAYANLLRHWNGRINLVSRQTIDQLWQRHISDSAQLFGIAPEGAETWIDLGTGAGLPGLPVAALAAEKAPGLHVTMIESDTRKAAFLAAAAQAMDLAVTITPERIEAVAPTTYDVVSARALAPLIRLCSMAHRFSRPGTVFLFPKGAKLDSELTEASTAWHIEAERVPSRTDPNGAILKILELDPRR